VSFFTSFGRHGKRRPKFKKVVSKLFRALSCRHQIGLCLLDELNIFCFAFNFSGFLADTFNGYMWSFTVAGILMQCAGILPIILVYLKKEERKPKERQIIEPEQV